MKQKPKRETNPEKHKVISEAMKVQMSPLNFQISADLHSDFKAKTAKEKKKMREVIEELIKNYTYNN